MPLPESISVETRNEMSRVRFFDCKSDLRTEANNSHNHGDATSNIGMNDTDKNESTGKGTSQLNRSLLDTRVNVGACQVCDRCLVELYLRRRVSLNGGEEILVLPEHNPALIQRCHKALSIISAHDFMSNQDAVLSILWDNIRECEEKLRKFGVEPTIFEPRIPAIPRSLDNEADGDIVMNGTTTSQVSHQSHPQQSISSEEATHTEETIHFNKGPSIATLLNPSDTSPKRVSPALVHSARKNNVNDGKIVKPSANVKSTLLNAKKDTIEANGKNELQITKNDTTHTKAVEQSSQQKLSTETHPTTSLGQPSSAPLNGATTTDTNNKPQMSPHTTTKSTALKRSEADELGQISCFGKIEGQDWGCHKKFANMAQLKAHWSNSEGKECLHRFITLRRQKSRK
jgi:hypothetical protein